MNGTILGPPGTAVKKSLDRPFRENRDRRGSDARAGREGRHDAATAAAMERSEDLAQVLILERSDRYRVRLICRERAGSRFVAAIGEMLGAQGRWIPARAFNFRRDELDALIDALKRAKAIL